MPPLQRSAKVGDNPCELKPKETTMRLVTNILFADLGIKHCSPMNRIQWTATAVTLAMWFCRA